MQRTSRRGFLQRSGKAAAAGLAGPWIVQASALGRDGAVAPSERLVMGAIGTGNMGCYDLGNFLTHDDVQFVAVCDVDAKHRENGKAKVDEAYGNKDCATYNEFERILDRDDIDAVLIATPDHWHALISIAAAKAGKDMYCEKPISLTIREGRAVVKAMKRYGRVYQSGTQRRSIDCFRFPIEITRAGKIGKLHTVHTYLSKGRSCPPQPEQPVPEEFDYNRWLGRAPWAPYPEKHS